MASLTDLFDETTLNEAELIEQLQDWMFNLTSDNIEETRSQFLSSVYAKTAERLEQFFDSFVTAIRFRSQNVDTYVEFFISLTNLASDDNVLKMLPSMVLELVSNPFHNQPAVAYFIRKCADSQLLSYREIVKELRIYRENNPPYGLMNAFYWFCPEIYEYDQRLYTDIFSNIKSGRWYYMNNGEERGYYYHKFIVNHQYFRNDDWKMLRELYDNKYVVNDYFKVLMNDDLEAFQNYANSPNFDITQTYNRDDLPFDTIFSTIYNIRAIDIACYYGSVKIIKSMLLMNTHLDDNALTCAIAGGNLELIRTLAQHKQPDNNSVETSIIYHQNNVFRWLTNTIEIELPKVATAAYQSNNVPLFLELFEKGLTISQWLEYKNYQLRNILPKVDIVRLILSIKTLTQFEFEKLSKITLLKAITHSEMKIVNEFIEHKFSFTLKPDNLIKTAIDDNQPDPVEKILTLGLTKDEVKQLVLIAGRRRAVDIKFILKSYLSNL